MSKYIPAEKLIAEIKIIQSSLEHRDVRFNQVKKIRTECMTEFCKSILEAIHSLQQEQQEVDLEKEFEDYLGNMEGQPRMWHPNEQIEWAKDIARHFAEWGAIHLNARKDE